MREDAATFGAFAEKAELALLRGQSGPKVAWPADSGVGLVAPQPQLASRSALI